MLLSVGNPTDAFSRDSDLYGKVGTVTLFEQFLELFCADLRQYKIVIKFYKINDRKCDVIKHILVMFHPGTKLRNSYIEWITAEAMCNLNHYANMPMQ